MNQLRAMPLSEQQPAIFISNVEALLSDEHVHGAEAKKVREVSQRAVWYNGVDTLVLPDKLDPDFAEYAASWGAEPKVIIPSGVDTNHLLIRDGFDDSALQVAISNTQIKSYVPDPVMAEWVANNRGSYYWGDAKAGPAVNDKGAYRELVEGIVDVPDGVLAQGLNHIVAAVRERLDKDGRAFVRHTGSGGGLGNRRFTSPDISNEQIAAKLAGDNPDHWHNGSALVEEYLDLVHSPAVTFTTNSGTEGDNLQITIDSDYVGSWLPNPEHIAPNSGLSERLENVGNTLADRLRRLGFEGTANTDLGITRDGRLLGFEINGRMTAASHKRDITRRTFCSGEVWPEGVVVKSLDKLILRHQATFRELRTAIGQLGVLATPNNPDGVVISIPPVENVAGLHFQGANYRQVEAMYQQVMQVVGDQRANRHDSPLFSNH